MKFGRWEIDIDRDKFFAVPDVFIIDMRQEPPAACRYYGHDIAVVINWLWFELHVVRAYI